MFPRLVTLLPIAVLAAVASAAPEPRTPTCNSGSVYCCNQTFSQTENFFGILGGLLTVVAGLGVPIGLQCSPITVIGALSTGSDCIIQTACCQNVQQIGLVNVACTPISAL